MDNKFKDFKKELNRVYRKNKIYKEKTDKAWELLK